MVGTLLSDILEGLPFADVKAKFAAKMHPLLHQRPQAAPTAGNIAQAEKIVAELGLEPSLARRAARLEDIQAIWFPQAPQAPSAPARGPVFSHLKAKGEEPSVAAPMAMPAKTITWDKFARTVLPGAKKIEVLLSSKMAICGLVAAVNPDSPPILQWDDGGENRNSVSWYVYHGGSTAEGWGLTSHEWADVSAVTLQPSMWSTPEHFKHQGHSAILILDGAQDQNNPSLCLFPEILKSSLHEVRSTIEAHSKSRELEGTAEGSAAGLRVGDNGCHCPIRVTTDTGVAVYKIDRWD
jgi:hypothetical protein